MSANSKGHEHQQARMPSVDARLAELLANALDGAELLGVTALGVDSIEHEGTAKSEGYGAPLRLDIRHEGRARSLVLHSATSNQFGHQRRADRASDMLLAADTFPLLPHHTRVLDVGAFRGAGFISLRDTGEFYLLTDYAPGRPYATDLREITQRGALVPLDVQRVDALVHYLVSIHTIKLPDATLYTRSIRDLIGSGEGIFGIVDGYPEHTPGVQTSRLARIEAACLGWRNRLKHKSRRLVRIHGDFHPFNVLFGDGCEMSALDASRGCAGDAADDVSAMAINFVFFALFDPGLWTSAFRQLWRQFWASYCEQSGDTELFEVVAPFLAWRGLVLANPLWYPDLPAEARTRLFDFIEAALEAPHFNPEMAQSVFD